MHLQFYQVCNLDLAKKFKYRFSNWHFRSYYYFPDIIFKSPFKHIDFYCVCQPDILCCTKYTTKVHGILEICHALPWTPWSILSAPLCRHQELLPGPPRGVSSTGFLQKASTPDPVHSGCSSTDVFQFTSIFFWGRGSSHPRLPERCPGFQQKVLKTLRPFCLFSTIELQ